jgi:seryl-tRNA synthetase
MLDIKVLRADPQQVAKQLQVKGFSLDTEVFERLESERRSLQSETEQLQNERNVKSKGIGQAKAKGEDIEPLLAEVSGLGERLEVAKEAFAEVQGELQNFLLAIPNLPHEEVPVGKDEADNKQLRAWGEPREFNFTPLDHVDLTEQGGLDFETAAKISGSRYVVMKGDVARLHRALTQFMLDTHAQQHGYQEVYVPYIVNADSLRGTGQLPKFAEDQFRIDQEQETYLIPTAEGAGN